ncbi:MAG: hypothetical protein LBJ45_00160 [Holosporaceae bacterium]|jgi:hypothetical protein|nr:hypothetical protein [Holosporaceae bacterium]
MKKNLVKCFFMAAGILSLSGAEGMMAPAAVNELLTRYSAFYRDVAAATDDAEFRRFLACDEVASAVRDGVLGGAGQMLTDSMTHDLTGADVTSTLNGVFVNVLEYEQPSDTFKDAFLKPCYQNQHITDVKKLFPELLAKHTKLRNDATATSDDLAASRSNFKRKLLTPMALASLTKPVDRQSLEQWFASFFAEASSRYSLAVDAAVGDNAANDAADNDIDDVIAFSDHVFLSKIVMSDGDGFGYKSEVAGNEAAFGRIVRAETAFRVKVYTVRARRNQRLRASRT